MLYEEARYKQRAIESSRVDSNQRSTCEIRGRLRNLQVQAPHSSPWLEGTSCAMILENVDGAAAALSRKKASDMSLVQLEKINEIAIIRMKNGVTNAISLELTEELQAALDEASPWARGLILAGGEKFFSIGIDLPSLLTFDRARLEEYWRRFNRFCFELYAFPRPTACAIEGHAIAGGTILSLMADWRVLASGRTLMGLNEIQLGLPIPYLPAIVLRQHLDDRAANKISYSGELHSPKVALELGLADAVCEKDNVLDSALEEVGTIARYPSEAFEAIKAVRTDSIRELYERNIEARTSAMLDIWFSEDALARMKKAAEKF